jgi:hypothetical protein
MIEKSDMSFYRSGMMGGSLILTTVRNFGQTDKIHQPICIIVIVTADCLISGPLAKISNIYSLETPLLIY